MTNEQNATIIKVRRGINGFKYAACDSDGYFIGNFEKLSDVRKHWQTEIKRGHIRLVRELNKTPDMSKINGTIELLDKYLRHLTAANR